MGEIKNVPIEGIGFHEGLQRELSTYFEKNIQEDGSVSIEQVNNPYFLINNKWNIDVIGEIKQFKEVVANYKYSNKNIHFRFNNPSINLEMKYVYYQYLFNELWAIKSIYGDPNGLNRITDFINDKYPKLSSLLELNIDKVEREYLFWLNTKGITTIQTSKYQLQKDTTRKSKVASFLRIVCTAFLQLTDNRDEWEKDSWDIRILHDKYGIHYNKTMTHYHLHFSNIDEKIREQVKRYFKHRLISKNKFSWSTALNYLVFLQNFFKFVFSLEPTWRNFNSLKRTHIEGYIEHLHEYAKSNLKSKNSHPEAYVRRSLSILQKFLDDIQRYEYEMAPEANVRLLVFPEDKPKLRKKRLIKLIIFQTMY